MAIFKVHAEHVHSKRSEQYVKAANREKLADGGNN
jgi:hypothetical protein